MRQGGEKSRSLSGRRARATTAVLTTTLVLIGLTPAQAQDPGIEPAAWRVECSGDGKVLDCRAVQQMVNRTDRALVASLTVYQPTGNTTPMLNLQLPLGLGLTDPIQIKVDDGAIEKQPIETCTNTGCFANLPLNDKLMAALRAGTTLKLTMLAPTKQAITLEVPLLGFGLAVDKALEKTGGAPAPKTADTTKACQGVTL